MINNNNRQQQNGRRRGRGGQRQQGGGGNPGRPEAGNRIDNRARGNAAQLHEKYKTLARDAQMQGDRVNTEYYLQFADHYFRVLSESRLRFEEARRPNEAFDDDESFDDDNEFGDIRTEAAPRYDQQQPRADAQRNDGQRDGQRGDGQRNDRDGNRDPQRGDGQRDQPRGDRDGQRSDQPRYEQGARRNGFNDNARGDAGFEPRREPAARDDFAGEDAGEAEPVAAPAPRRLRPRREAAAPVEGGLDPAQLPPALGIGALSAEDALPEEKPRRRRGRPPAAETAQAS